MSKRGVNVQGPKRDRMDMIFCMLATLLIATCLPRLVVTLHVFSFVRLSSRFGCIRFLARLSLSLSFFLFARVLSLCALFFSLYIRLASMRPPWNRSQLTSLPPPALSASSCLPLTTPATMPACFANTREQSSSRRMKAKEKLQAEFARRAGVLAYAS